MVLPIPPLLMEPRESEAEVPGEPSPPEGGLVEMDRTMLEGVRLLVVEDDADSREMLVTVFEQCGADGERGGFGGEAMEALQRATPDVLVCESVCRARMATS